MKVLEAYCKVAGWKGGTIHQVIEDVKTKILTEEVERCLDVQKLGHDAGLVLLHGLDISQYPVPTNSWDKIDNHDCTVNYIYGLLDGIWDATRYWHDSALINN